MKGLLSVAVFFLLCISIQGQNELKFEFDYARFNYDTSAVYLEFYYDLNPSNMEYFLQENKKYAEAIIHLEMKNQETNQNFIDKIYKINNPIEENGQKSLTGVFGFVVPKGKYSILIEAHDSKNEKLSKTIKESIVIIPHTTEKYSISDIQLAQQIKREGVDPNSIFYKNTLEVIPNPAMYFNESSPVLFYYTELYNLKLKNQADVFNLQKLLYDSQGRLLYKISKTIKQSESSVVDIGAINLSKFGTDSYNLVLSLIDTTTHQAYVSSKRFYLSNSKAAALQSNQNVSSGVVSSEYAVFTSEECDLLFNQAKYIAAKNEIAMYKKLDSLNAKREFLYNFWRMRDPDLTTDKNEAKEDYMRLVNYAQQNFKLIGKEGYLTDRGRVLLTFGEPDQKDFYPNESSLKPYEVWSYHDIEGGVDFIFGDVRGFGNYELLHSTKLGELRDENWQMRLMSR